MYEMKTVNLYNLQFCPKIKTMEKQNKSEMYFVPLSEQSLYEEKIKPLLAEIAEKAITFEQLVIYLKEFKILTSSVRSQDYGLSHQNLEYKALKNFKFQVLPLFKQISKFILYHQDLFSSKQIKILLQGTTDQITFTKQQVIYILCLMAFNLVPVQQYESQQFYNKRKNFPFIHDFEYIFSHDCYKTQCVVEYFKLHLMGQEQWVKRNEKFVVKRLRMDESVEQLVKKYKGKYMGEFDIRSDAQSIQDFTGQGKVDFANKFIGGGALHRGCVQEEIMFTNHPQLLISVIFCEVMNKKESILLQGFRKYSKNKGYARTTQYDGQQKIDESTFEKEEYIIAIDALRFQNKYDTYQLQASQIDRQIIKAYAGFSSLPEGINVVTGNWGCGAFSGDIRLKFLIQWLASSMAGKQMVYCPYGSRGLLEANLKTFEILKSLTIPAVYQLLIKGAQRMNKMNENIFKHISYLLEKKNF